jgi:hypothetical protein
MPYNLQQTQKINNENVLKIGENDEAGIGDLC